MTLYWPLIAGTANVILTAEIFGIERTSLWNNDGHLTVRATLFMTSRESAGVTLSLYLGSIFQAFLRVKCNITVISLLFGKYTRTFVPRFPGTDTNVLNCQNICVCHMNREECRIMWHNCWEEWTTVWKNVTRAIVFLYLYLIVCSPGRMSVELLSYLWRARAQKL